MPIRVGPEIAALTNAVLILDAKNSASYNGFGDIWYDLSGRGNHFSLQNNPVWSGTTGTITFNQNGGSQYAIATNNDVGDFGTGNFTIELVLSLPAAQASPGGGQGIIANRDKVTEAYGDGNRGFSVGIGNQASFRDNGWIPNNAQTLFNQNGDYPLSSSISYQAYTVTRYGPNNYSASVALYRNGELVNRGANPNPITYHLANTSGSAYPTADGKIDGSIELTLMKANTFGTASLYTVRLYNTVLDSVQIRNNYNLYRDYYGF